MGSRRQNSVWSYTRRIHSFCTVIQNNAFKHGRHKWRTSPAQSKRVNYFSSNSSDQVLLVYLTNITEICVGIPWSIQTFFPRTTSVWVRLSIPPNWIKGKSIHELQIDSVWWQLFIRTVTQNNFAVSRFASPIDFNFLNYFGETHKFVFVFTFCSWKPTRTWSQCSSRKPFLLHYPNIHQIHKPCPWPIFESRVAGILHSCLTKSSYRELARETSLSVFCLCTFNQKEPLNKARVTTALQNQVANIILMDTLAAY